MAHHVPQCMLIRAGLTAMLPTAAAADLKAFVLLNPCKVLTSCFRTLFLTFLNFHYLLELLYAQAFDPLLKAFLAFLQYFFGLIF